MFCPYCGQQNSDDIGSCESCGQPLPEIILQEQNEITPALPKTSKLAIWSLALSLGALIVGAAASIAGIVCGIVGIKRICKSAGTLKGNGIAIAGIVISVVHLIIIVPLAITIMMTAIPMAKQMMCSVNINSLSKAMTAYADDYDGKYPSPNWCNLLIDYADVSEQQFRCPGAKEGPSNYAMNINAVKFDSNTPNDLVLLFETSPGWNQVGGAEILTAQNHKGDGCHIIFANGSMRFVEIEDVNSLKWTAE